MASASPSSPAAAPGRPLFADRAAAGAALAEALRELRFDQTERVLVLALPRGGVAVAGSVARALDAPLDVLVVRKIGHPDAPELGLGAIAEAGEPVFDAEMLDRVGLMPQDLAGVVARETAELTRRVAVYRGASRPGGRPGGGRPPDVAGTTVILVDDGLATGVTARAALRALRARGAARSVLAVPVASRQAAQAMKEETGEVVAVATPHRFRSVGEWYADFGQLTDDDVLMLLSSGERTPAPPDESPGRCRG